MITVEPVLTRRQWRAFSRVPWDIYRDDPNWVPTPAAAERDLLDPDRNPFFQHARGACWLARCDGAPCGRIAAFLDDNHNSLHQENAGFFGFLEFIEDAHVAAALLGMARAWVHQHGAVVLRGPVNPSTNYECGLLIDGFDRPPSVMMPYHRPYYARCCEEFGLVRARDLYAYWFDLAPGLPPKAAAAAARARRRTGLRVRTLNIRRLEDDIRRAREIYDRAWQRNWGFVPLTDAEWANLARMFRPILRSELGLFAEVDGEPIGMALAFPDMAPLLLNLRKWWWPLVYLKIGLGAWKARDIRFALMGLVPEHQNLGVAAVLYEEMYRQAHALGIQGAEFSWILEDNLLGNRAAQSMGGRLYKTYRLYEMPLATGARV